MRPLHQKVILGIGRQLQRFVRERDCPVFLQLGGQLSKDKSIRNAAIVSVMIAKRVVHVGFVPHVDNGVAPHVGQGRLA